MLTLVNLFTKCLFSGFGPTIYIAVCCHTVHPFGYFRETCGFALVALLMGPGHQPFHIQAQTHDPVIQYIYTHIKILQQ